MKLIKKADIILAAIVILATIVIGFAKNTDAPCEAVIYLDGKEYMRVNLQEEKEQIIQIENMRICAHNGKIQVLASDCHDKTCINMGEAEKNGSMIACVPNKIVIRIVKSDDGVDGVTG